MSDKPAAEAGQESCVRSDGEAQVAYVRGRVEWVR
jgi:hypothetical protein